MFCACMEKLRCENRYDVYVYGVNAECIERLRCGSRYIVYNFGANGACMEKVRFGISRGGAARTITMITATVNTKLPTHPTTGG